VALPATDNFDRADGPIGGGNWARYALGVPAIATNVVVPEGVGSDSAAAWITDTPAADQYAQIKLVTINTNTQRAAGCLVRGGTTGIGSSINGYVGLARGPFGASTTLAIWKFVSGGQSTLTSTTTTVAANDILKFTATGTTTTTLTIYINGVQKLQTTDASSPFTSGLGGIYIFTDAGAASDAALDLFEVGNVSASTITLVQLERASRGQFRGMR
jgi:hypothetical protein